MGSTPGVNRKTGAPGRVGDFAKSASQVPFVRRSDGTGHDHISVSWDVPFTTAGNAHRLRSDRADVWKNDEGHARVLLFEPVHGHLVCSVAHVSAAIEHQRF